MPVACPAARRPAPRARPPPCARPRSDRRGRCCGTRAATPSARARARRPTRCGRARSCDAVRPFTEAMRIGTMGAVDKTGWPAVAQRSARAAPSGRAGCRRAPCSDGRGPRPRAGRAAGCAGARGRCRAGRRRTRGPAPPATVWFAGPVEVGQPLPPHVGPAVREEPPHRPGQPERGQAEQREGRADARGEHQARAGCRAPAAAESRTTDAASAGATTTMRSGSRAGRRSS